MARVFISHSSRDKEPAARIMGWLHTRGFETPFLDFDKHAGIPPGADWEKTLYREIERSEAVIVIQTPNWLEFQVVLCRIHPGARAREGHLSRHRSADRRHPDIARHPGARPAKR